MANPSQMLCLKLTLQNIKYQPFVSKFLIAKSESSVKGDAVLEKWIILVNGKEVTPEDARKTLVGTIPRESQKPITFVLSLRKAAAAPPPPPEETEEKRKFDLDAKIRKMIQARFDIYKKDLNTNGMQDVEIRHVLGHFSVQLKGIQLPLALKDVFIDLDFHLPGRPPTWILDNKPPAAQLMICPYSTYRHVSMLCVFNQRVVHIDPSGSISGNNNLLLQRHLGNVSYTWLNYQKYDDTNIDDELAGGNCAVFTCLNGLRCILHFDKYSNRKHTFEDFWRRFEKVASVSNRRVVMALLNDLIGRLTYMNIFKDGQSKGDYGNSVFEFCAPGQNVGINSTNMEMPKLIAEILSQGRDFTADCMMLDLFIESQMSFENIAKLGTMFRSLLEEMTAHGFVNAYCKYIGTTYKVDF